MNLQLLLVELRIFSNIDDYFIHFPNINFRNSFNPEFSHFNLPCIAKQVNNNALNK